MEENREYSEWLIDFSLKENDLLSDEFKQTYDDFFSNSVLLINDRFDDENTVEDTDEELDEESDEERDDGDAGELIDDINESLKFNEVDFINVTSDVRLFMTKTCSCCWFKKKYACCYNFKPIEIQEMRDSCAFRDHWHDGINLLNELVLGSIGSSVHANYLNDRCNIRINKHASLYLMGKRICKLMFIFAHNFTIKRYDLIRKRFNQYGFSLQYHGNMGNQNNSIDPNLTIKTIETI